MSDAAPLSMWRHDTIRHRPTNGQGVTVRSETRDEFIAAAAARHGIRPHEILGSGRSRPVASARQEVMWRLRQIQTADGAPKHSYPAIALALGGLDHTTVLAGCRRHAARLAEAALVE